MTNIVGMIFVLLTFFVLYIVLKKAKKYSKYSYVDDFFELEIKDNKQLKLKKELKISKENLKDHINDLLDILERADVDRTYNYVFDGGLIQKLIIDSILDDYIFLDVNDKEIIRFKGSSVYTVLSDLLPQYTPNVVEKRKKESEENNKYSKNHDTSEIKRIIEKPKKGKRTIAGHYNKEEVEFLISVVKASQVKDKK